MRLKGLKGYVSPLLFVPTAPEVVTPAEDFSAGIGQEFLSPCNPDPEIPQEENRGKRQLCDSFRPNSRRGRKEGSLHDPVRRKLLKALSRKVETRRLIRLLIAMHQKQVGSQETISYRKQIRNQISQAGIILPTA